MELLQQFAIGARLSQLAGMDACYRQSVTVLKCSGEDHLAFLQGQGTADFLGPVGICQYSLWLDFRGHILADAFVLRESEAACLLVSYTSPADLLLEKFDRHIIADDVVMEDCSNAYELLSVAPSGVGAFLEASGLQPPESGRFRPLTNGFLFAGHRMGTGGLELLGQPGSTGEWVPQTLSTSAMERLRIESGVPDVARDAAPEGLNPVEAGLLSAISFEKGCYLGQEVVARVHRLDRASRRMVSVSGPMDTRSVPIQLEVDGSPVGKLTSVVDFHDSWIALGWLKQKIGDGQVRFDQGLLEVKSLSPN